MREAVRIVPSSRTLSYPLSYPVSPYLAYLTYLAYQKTLPPAFGSRYGNAERCGMSISLARV